MKTCKITLSDYRAEMPHWHIEQVGCKARFTHPTGIWLEVDHNDEADILGDRQEIISSNVDLFRDIATRKLRARESAAI